MAASSSDAADDFDLYGDIDISTQLPSHVELERSLEAAVARRTGLQAELQSLQQQFAAGKPRVEDLTRRMCILLQTAQLEIKRKEDQLDALRAPSARTAPQAATLAAEQKQLLGERLFPLVQAVEPHLAGKITGMLLQMDTGELLALLDEPEVRVRARVRVRVRARRGTGGLHGKTLTRTRTPTLTLTLTGPALALGRAS